MGLTVGVAGASGYAGGELLRLLAGHPHLEIGAVTAQSSAGALVTDVHPHLVSLGARRFAATDPAALAEADLVFLALPHGESATVAAALPATVKVVDLGADFRLRDPAAWSAYYSGPHAGTSAGGRFCSRTCQPEMPMPTSAASAPSTAYTRAPTPRGACSAATANTKPSVIIAMRCRMHSGHASRPTTCSS